MWYDKLKSFLRNGWNGELNIYIEHPFQTQLSHTFRNMYIIFRKINNELKTIKKGNYLLTGCTISIYYFLFFCNFEISSL